MRAATPTAEPAGRRNEAQGIVPTAATQKWLNQEQIQDTREVTAG